MKLLLEKIHCEKYTWNICGNLKVIALLLGLQLGYTKYFCFLCEWNSRERKPLRPKTVAKKRFTYSRKEKCASNLMVNPEKFRSSITHQTWTVEKFRQGNG
jgi:hypothetical protein